MTESNPSSSTSSSCCRGNRTWSGVLKVGALVIVSAIAGAMISRAVAHWHWRHHGFMHGTMEPADAEKRAGRMIGHLAREVSASGEQKKKLEEIAAVAVKDILPMRNSLMDGRKEARALLGSATIDRAAVEKLRADQLANLDQLSKRLATAMTDAAEVLTPEQRKTLADRLESRGGWWKHGGSRD